MTSPDETLNVLVAEDDPLQRILIESTLEKHGIRHTSTCDGLNAWNAMQRAHFPVLISDCMMPSLDGIELIRRVRSMRADRYTYIIMLTGMGGRSNHLNALAAGADDFLTKPLDPAVLHARLHVARRILGLQQHVKYMETLLCICASCKKIRNEEQQWTQLERYISSRAGVSFSHSLCPTCVARWEADAQLV